MNDARVYIEVKDADGKVLRTIECPAIEFKIDTRRRNHDAILLGQELFRVVREAALVILKRGTRSVVKDTDPRWVKEHERDVWHREGTYGLWTMLCGAVIPGAPPASKERPQGETCEQCRFAEDDGAEVADGGEPVGDVLRAE